jgi:hypothetical protein
MSLITTDAPAWMQNGVYPARLDRQVIDAIWSEGVLSGLDVSPRSEGANFSVDVAIGRAVITGDDQSGQGSYLVSLSGGKVNVPLSVPDSLGRIDLVVCKVNDSQAGGPAGDNGTVYAVKGTPASTPTVPTLPTSAVELARVTVAASAVSITAPNIDSTKRVKAMPRSVAEKPRVLAVVTTTTTYSASDPNSVVVGPTGTFILTEPRTVAFTMNVGCGRATNPGLNSVRLYLDGAEYQYGYFQHNIANTGGPGQEYGGTTAQADLAAGTHTFRFSLRSLTGGATAQLLANSRIVAVDTGPISGLL